MLNKQSGNMYPWVTHTWNVIKGKCPHECNYCYMKKWKLNPIHFDEDELKTDLGSGNVIFVGSSCDMFADGISDEWIEKILDYCKKFDNTYLFQTKNPKRFHDFVFPKKTIYGTTIESDYYDGTKAPDATERAIEMSKIKGRKMVSIEPVIDFYIDEMVSRISMVKPEFVSIGADSQNSNLPEPTAKQVQNLIYRLEEFTVVKVKDNLSRIMED